MTEAVDRAHDAIRQGILEGRFPPGTRLVEEQLAEEIGLSTTPVREAVQRLAAEGVVEFVPHRGAHVASWSASELDVIFELRSMLEGFSASLAATRIDKATIGRLEELAERMEEAARSDDEDRLDRIATLNNTFHAEVVSAAADRHVSRLLEGLQQAPLVHRTFRRYDERALARSMAHHRELIDAFRAHDAAWARTVMTAHVLAAKAVLRS